MLYQYNDNELLYLIYEGNEEALGILFKKYENLIKKRIADFHIKANDYEDFFQEGLMSLFTAIRVFNPFMNKSFNKFFDLILQRRFMTILRGEKNYFYNVTSFTYEGILREDSKLEQDYFENMLIDTSYDDIDTFDYDGILTKWEAKVYKLRYKEGFPCKEVAKITKSDIKSIYNALFQIKKKLKSEIQKRKK